LSEEERVRIEADWASGSAPSDWSAIARSRIWLLNVDTVLLFLVELEPSGAVAFVASIQIVAGSRTADALYETLIDIFAPGAHLIVPMLT
jgi:hypothetical protein